jgi:hypothetical protein
MAGTVTVANKLSFPLTLSVSNGHWEDATEPSGRPTKIYIHGDVASYTVRGFGAQRRLESGGKIIGETGRVVGNYGLTPNIPVDFWDRWLEENNRPGSSFFGMIREGLIFAHSRQPYIVGKAKEMAKVRSGTGNRTSEPDPRVERSVATMDRDSA